MTKSSSLVAVPSEHLLLQISAKAHSGIATHVPEWRVISDTPKNQEVRDSLQWIRTRTNWESPQSTRLACARQLSLPAAKLGGMDSPQCEALLQFVLRQTSEAFTTNKSNYAQVRWRVRKDRSGRRGQRDRHQA